MSDWAEDAARAAALALPVVAYASPQAVKSVATLLRAERERSVRAGLAAAARVALETGIELDERLSSGNAKGHYKQAKGLHGKSQTAHSLADAIRQIDPTIVTEECK